MSVITVHPCLDDLASLRSATEALRAEPGSTLILTPGVYTLSDPSAQKLQRDVMAGRLGNNPEPVMFSPEFKYSIGLDFAGVKDATVIGDGAEIISDGFMETLSLRECENVTLRGLSFDLKRKAFTRGYIIGRGENYTDAYVGDDGFICPASPSPRIIISDPATGRIAAITYSDRKEWLSNGVMRFYDAKIGDGMIGFNFIIVHTFHFRPMILMHNAENLTLDGVSIYNNCGMGIVGHRTKNITLRGLRIVPDDGHKMGGGGMSVNTDATHFTSCEGEIRFEDCVFEGNGDDCTNVHTYYQTIDSFDGDTCIASIKSPTGTHCQKSDVPDVGDTLEYMSKTDLYPLETYKVIASRELDGRFRCEIKLDRPLPSDAKGNYLLNATKMPALTFIGCRCLNHLARSVLVKTRNVLIENCVFSGATGTAIHIGAEGHWHEGGGTANVTVRDNLILHCGEQGHGRIRSASAVAVTCDADKPDKPIHHNITVENNRIESSLTRAVYASNVSGLTVRGNTNAEVVFDPSSSENAVIE